MEIEYVQVMVYHGQANNQYQDVSDSLIECVEMTGVVQSVLHPVRNGVLVHGGEAHKGQHQDCLKCTMPEVPGKREVRSLSLHQNEFKGNLSNTVMGRQVLGWLWSGDHMCVCSYNLI